MKKSDAEKILSGDWKCPKGDKEFVLCKDWTTCTIRIPQEDIDWMLTALAKRAIGKVEK